MKKTKSVKNRQRRNSIKTKSKKILVLENKKRFEEIKEDKQIPVDLEDEEENENSEFSRGFQLTPIPAKRNLKNLPAGNSLESELAFAPRVRNKDKEGKDYSEKYEIKYNEGKYGEKTPNEYAGVEPISKPSEDSTNQ